MTGSKLRVAFPLYNADAYNWERTSLVLQPLSREVDLQVFHFEDQASPDADWCRFTKVPHPQNLVNLHVSVRDAVRIVAELPDFDVLYCWSGGAYYQLLSVLVAQAAKKPVVMHINGDGALSRRHHLQPLDKLLQDTVDRLSLNNVDLVVPISSVLRDAMLQRVKNAAAVSESVPFTVDTEHFSPDPSLPEKVVVGYGGRVSPEKGFPFFVHVMEATPQLSYRLAGPFQMNLGLPDNCHYDGVISLLDMPGFYAKCSVLALPSFGEGVPGMVLEAYACGRPVVVTPESLPPCLPCFGWTVGRDVAEWKRTLEGITQGEVQRYGEDARRWVTSQWPSWGDFAVTMRKKFEQV